VSELLVSERGELLALLAAAVDEVLGSDILAPDDDSLRAEVRALETQLIRLRQAQRQRLAELNRRNVAGQLGLRGLPQLIQAELRCTSGTATRMSQAVQRFGPRRALTGQPLAPEFPCVAEGLTDGVIGLEHAGVIAEAIEALPAPVRAERGAEVEATLVSLAQSKDPLSVKVLARRIVAHLDPDGPAPREVERQQQSRRRLILARYGDGGAELTGFLSPACRAIWESVLTPLAAQRPMDATGEDTRTAEQRLHDAFEQAGRLLLGTGKLPEQAGLPSTLVITMRLADLERRAGAATTHHGGTLSVAEALRIAADAQLIPVVLSDAAGVLSYGRGRRLASPPQRRALFARDRGCTFPDCTVPAARAEIHHATEWTRGGETNVDTMAMACGYHNNEAPRQGWKTLMINGIPHWQPPPWRDPDQVPIRNYVHHPELIAHQLAPPPDPDAGCDTDLGCELDVGHDADSGCEVAAELTASIDESDPPRDEENWHAQDDRD
jgi:hypothetical protein